MTQISIEDRFLQEAEKLSRGCVDVLPANELAKLLARADKEKRPLRIKLGMDPTSPDIHLGHAVVLTKMREFQDAGHTVILIIGDYTARVGDPSGRSKSRPVVSGDQIDANAITYQKQVFRILDESRTEVRYNGEWLAKLTTEEMFSLQRGATVAQILEREDFSARMKRNEPITLLELLYPLVQGYDSVAIKADIEFGGTDQLFNLLMGRHLQPQYGQHPQVIMTMPILTGTDGVEKMSKSLGNYIGVEDNPNDMFGKAMSIPDAAMPEWWRYASGVEARDADDWVQQLESDSVHPNEAKRALARAIVERFYDADTAISAEERFNVQFKERSVPEDIAEMSLQDVPLNDAGMVFMPALLVNLGWASSSGEARRLIKGAAVKIDGKTLDTSVLEVDLSELQDVVLQAGKRKFIRIFTQ